LPLAFGRPVVTNESRLLNVIEAATRLSVSASYLNKLRITGGGPPFLKIGARVAYDPVDLSTWLEGQKRRSTSDAGGVAR
jgi:predicted DNA-binding transcriptional regulator AlpA